MTAWFDGLVDPGRKSAFLRARKRRLPSGQRQGFESQNALVAAPGRMGRRRLAAPFLERSWDDVTASLKRWDFGDLSVPISVVASSSARAVAEQGHGT